MILVIGELITDIFIYCDCKRLSPESKPTPILTPIKKELNFGGAGNVVENLKSLGVTNVVGIHQDYQIVKTRYVVDNHHVMRLDENDKCEELTWEKLQEKLGNRKLNNFDAIVISDYCKNLVSERLIIKLAENYDGPIFIDTKKKKGKWCESVDFIKINDKEWEENFDKKYNGQANVFVTRGDKGVEWINKKLLVDTKKIDVANVCGCGDSSLSGLVVEYLKSGNTIKSLEFANEVAGIAASKKGVVAVKQEWLDL